MFSKFDPTKFLSFKRYFKNTCGNVGMLLAFAAVPLLGGVGAAVDYARVVNSTEYLQTAADAAVLAGTQALAENGGKTADALSIAKKLFDAALDKQGEAINSKVAFKMNAAGTGVEAVGNAEMPASILFVIGISQLTLLGDAASVVAAANLGSGEGAAGDLEISLVLDVTGSMCSDGVGPCSNGAKLDAMKTSAAELIDRVVWDDQSKYTSKVAVVPFASHIRVGPDAGGGAVMKNLTNLNPTWSGYKSECLSGYNNGSGVEGAQGWVCTNEQVINFTDIKIRPCVSDRYYQDAKDFDYTDNAPWTNRWLNAASGTRAVLAVDSTEEAYTVQTGTATDPAKDDNYSTDGVCWFQTQSNELLPLTNDKATLMNRVQGLTAQRWTGGALGASFGWFTLSPKWNGMFATFGGAQSYSKLNQTLPNGNKALRKIMVFMTDGAFNSYRGWPDDQKVAKISTATKEICDAAKGNGIEIFTVAYDLDNVPANDRAHAENTLKACATDKDHFYRSLNGAELKAAFEDIATQIIGSGTLRLTQ